jgi:hydroxyacylglutathione hydrolase
MSALETLLIPCLSDNYAVLLHEPQSGATAVVDAPDAKPILAALKTRGWTLTDIFVTHHHNDHTAGIGGLKAEYGATVTGPEEEAERIAGIDRPATEKNGFVFAGQPVRVLETPGHTLGHVTYVLPESKLAFTGDTLFSLGCGRLFEGDARLMWTSLQKIAALADDTVLYCGHEYTLANGRFAKTVEPENDALLARLKEVEALRAAGKPTLPTTLGQEKATNPFLRAHSLAIRGRLGLISAPDWQVFGRLRELKNKA